jgi:D-alanyl-D-alanine carboxypeptidase
MAKTRYVNSHGLSNGNNKSTAFDICLLCNYAIKNQIFREIVSCRAYEGLIKLEFKPELDIDENGEELLFGDENMI